VGSIECASLVIVGGRTPEDALFQELNADQVLLADSGISTVRSIGDCRAPGAIAHAVYSGHECARWERPELQLFQPVLP
jgi:dimethylamine/trimethylamine dehydrogenase